VPPCLSPACLTVSSICDSQSIVAGLSARHFVQQQREPASLFIHSVGRRPRRRRIKLALSRTRLAACVPYPSPSFSPTPT
jgi:hypothetical protein